MLNKFFPRITDDEYTMQQARVAEQTNLQASQLQQERENKELTKRGPGRPKKQELLHPRQDSDEALIKTKDAEDENNQRPTKRGKYIDWFSTPLIHHIIKEFHLTGNSSRKTVENLQRLLPHVYKDLSHSTIDSWYDRSSRPIKLKPQYQLLLDQSNHSLRLTRGPGREALFTNCPDVEEEIKTALEQLRQQGATVNIAIVRWVMQGITEEKQPQLLTKFRLSKSFISAWVHSALQWSWRKRTTAASKLPLDWRQQGIKMAKRIAAGMQLNRIHPSLIINLDQTGMQLVPSSQRTFEKKGDKSVAVIAAEDKRQITVVLASSMNGNMLPLQMIFQGETSRSLPPQTPEIVAAEVHLTHSSNHWSNQETMKDYIKRIILPYYNKQIEENKLAANSKMMIVLDAWSVHKSEEFRMHLRINYPFISLVFVPANCTSKLQVADVALQRPFKHGVRSRFDLWAAQTIKAQIKSGVLTGLTHHLRMKSIKPMIVQWCIQSWQKLREQKQFITFGWHMCCSSFFDVNDPEKRLQVLEEIALEQLERLHIPDEDEPPPGPDQQSDSEEESDHEENAYDDDEDDELNVMTQRIFGTRQSNRSRTATQRFGYSIRSSQIDFVATGSEDSDANGMDIKM